MSSHRNVKIAVGVIIVVAIAVVGYLIVNKNNVTPTPVATNQPAARATTLQKNLLVKGSNEQAFFPVEESKDVFLGDILKTESEGRGVVESPNGSISMLDYNSEMKIAVQNTAGTQSNSFLNSGYVWAQVQKVFDKGEFYEIETQNAVAVVRGTFFGVGYEPGETNLQVVEGSVMIIPINKDTRARMEDKAQLITGGNEAFVKDDGSITTKIWKPKSGTIPEIFNVTVDTSSSTPVVRPKPAAPKPTVRATSTPTTPVKPPVTPYDPPPVVEKKPTSTAPATSTEITGTAPQRETPNNPEYTNNEEPTYVVPASTTPVSKTPSPTLSPATVRSAPIFRAPTQISKPTTTSTIR